MKLRKVFGLPESKEGSRLFFVSLSMDSTDINRILLAGISLQITVEPFIVTSSSFDLCLYRISIECDFILALLNNSDATTFTFL